jgi:predicted Zn-dependent peptidase
VTPTDKDYIPLQVTDTLLGGAFTSRITNNIREQKGYTYSPFSHVLSRSWQESAQPVDFKQDFAHRVRIQNLLGGLFVLQNSSNQGIIGQLSFLEVHGLSDDYIRTYIQKVNAVTRADVQRITESYLNPSKMTLVVVGDKAKIEESLKPYQPKP